jgi:4-hydroxy-tetrahydrodipicolinate synthase
VDEAEQRFKGIFTPLVTPIDADERIDHDSVRRLVEFQIERGVHGLWAMGTTGEFAAFDPAQRASYIETVVEGSAGQAPVIANVSDAGTKLVIEHARRAEQAGADALAATPPYYFPHSQSELIAHYTAIASAVELPLYIYNIPQTVRTSVSLETAMDLAADGIVAGIKDSQNDLEWFRTLTLWASSKAPGFRAFAGTRHLIDAAVMAGAAGAIPSIANAHPDLCVQTFEFAASGDFHGARQCQSQIVAYENAVTVGRGSRNAAVIAGLKRILAERGIIASDAITAPLLA